MDGGPANIDVFVWSSSHTIRFTFKHYGYQWYVQVYEYNQTQRSDCRFVTRRRHNDLPFIAVSGWAGQSGLSAVEAARTTLTFINHLQPLTTIIRAHGAGFGVWSSSGTVVALGTELTSQTVSWVGHSRSIDTPVPCIAVTCNSSSRRWLWIRRRLCSRQWVGLSVSPR